MKTRAIYIALIFIPTIICFGQNTHITGQVYDSLFTDSYIPNTIVTAYIDGSVIGVDTVKDASGYEIAFTITNIEKEQTLPNKFEVYQNYPNPFNPHTTIRFDTPESGTAHLSVFDIRGQKLNDQERTINVSAGTHEIQLEMENYSNGIYIYHLTLNEKTKIGKMMFIHNSVPKQTSSKGYLPKTFTSTQEDEKVTLTFTNTDYETDSTVLFMQPEETITENKYLNQIPKTEKRTIKAHITDEYGNLPNAAITTYNLEQIITQGNTDTTGTAILQFYPEYKQDPQNPEIKIYTPTEIKNEITAENHHPETIYKTITAQDTITLQQQLQIINKTINFRLHYVDIVDGVALTDADVIIKWSDDSVKTYANNNGVVEVTKVLEGVDENTRAEMWHSNLDGYLHWIVGRTYERNQYGKEPIFQNDDWESNAFFSVEQLDGLKDVYIGSIDREVEYSIDGVNLGMLQSDGPEILYMMRRDPGRVVHNKPQSASYKIRNIQFIENQITGEVMSDYELDRARDQMQTVIDAYDMSDVEPNGILLEEHEPIRRISVNSQEWANIKAQDFENTNWTVFGGAPSNYVDVTSVPEFRKKHSDSQYNESHPNSQILEEIFAQFTNTTATSRYITYTTEGDELTPAALMMLRTNAWFRSKTIY